MVAVDDGQAVISVEAGGVRAEVPVEVDTALTLTACVVAGVGDLAAGSTGRSGSGAEGSCGELRLRRRR